MFLPKERRCGPAGVASRIPRWPYRPVSARHPPGRYRQAHILPALPYHAASFRRLPHESGCAPRGRPWHRARRGAARWQNRSPRLIPCSAPLLHHELDSTFPPISFLPCFYFVIASFLSSVCLFFYFSFFSFSLYFIFFFF